MIVKIKQILELKKGKKPHETLSFGEKDYLPYVDIKAFEKGIVDTYTNDEKCLPCDDGDLLIVCDGSRSGLVGRAIKGYVGSTLARIDLDSSVYKNYIYYYIQGKYALLNTKKKGTGTPHLNAELLKEADIFLPDLPTQHRIVTRIEELFSQLDSGVETLKKTKEQLKVYRQAVLKEAFSHINAYNTIRNVSTLVTSGSRGWAKYYSNSGAIFVRIGNLTRTGIDIDFKDTQFVELPDKAEGVRSKLLPNDVLVSITADLGSIGLVPDNIDEAYINQHIALVRFNNPNQGKFMAYYLRSDYGQKELLKNKRGAGKLGLGLDDIRDSRVPIVTDDMASSIVAEIESRLSVCDSIEKTIDTALQEAEALRQSILKQAFEGGL